MKGGNAIENGITGTTNKSWPGELWKTGGAATWLGGKNQQPMAYNPQTKLFYVPANEWGMEIWNEPISYKKGAAYLGAGFTIRLLLPF